MTERFEDLGGQLSEFELPVPVKPVKLHNGPCQHADGHVCPLSNETVTDDYGYDKALPCDCTEESA